LQLRLRRSGSPHELLAAGTRATGDRPRNKSQPRGADAI